MTDGLLKLGYTSVIFVDLGVKVDGRPTYIAVT